MANRPASFKASPQLRMLRMVAGMDSQDLAQRAGVKRSQMSAIELGQRGASPEVAARIAKALGHTLNEAVGLGYLILDTGVTLTAESADVLSQGTVSVEEP